METKTESILLPKYYRKTFKWKQKQTRSFYQSNIERLLHLNPEDGKTELQRLKITTKTGMNRNLVI